MIRAVLVACIAVTGCGILALTGEEAQPAVYTAVQAAAWRTAYESTCLKCHTPTLLGRNGDPGELPPLSSIPAVMQKVVRDSGGKVPPLADASFMARWSQRTTKALSTRIQTAVGGFPPEGTDEQTSLKITAYILQVNGARPGSQELTAATAVGIQRATGVGQANSDRH